MLDRVHAIVAAAVVALAIPLAWPSDAAAQIAALVNGDPITMLDITQRIRLTEISSHKQQTREEALNDLINEKLKLQIAKRYIINITDKDVDTAFASMAHQAGLSAEEFSEALSKAGISVPALKARVKADIGWGAIIRGKFQGSLQIGDKEVREAVRARQHDKPATPMFQFKLRQVLFIVPRGAPDAVYETRKKDAETLRTRFENCDQGVPMARALPDVTVRNPVNRSSMDVPAKKRESIDNTPMGHLTPPEITQFGVETFAVCSKEEIHGDAPEEREVREEMLAQRFEAQSKRYLEELRRSAMIELR